ncbi:L-aspartate oxidase [Rurimicrobium arvi]|uniref:L-aspartate oxidase n=1 Tax=Rurimicrobium arvi TaxID=2049916 RepID=A0ABP8MUY1_9BACT
MQTDFLVIGSGIAGLSFAIKTAKNFPDKEITILTKANTDETNTKYAQGGIAVMSGHDSDTFDQHIQDTLIAGDGLCNREIVEIVVKEGPERVAELIEWGANFDKDSKGEYLQGKEGGHSQHRILHHKDITGFEIERALLTEMQQYPNIKVYNHWFVIDIITQHHLGYLVTKSTSDIECYGVYALNLHNGKTERILSRVTLMASGGVGQVYRTTTNPSIATGDGIAMVYRAKGRIENMEFIQFHPTAMYQPNTHQSFLITEAVRGDGGILRNHKGEAFMERYDSRKDLAPRDIVARAIDNEMKRSGTEFVYLDCRQMDKERFLQHFPNIYEACKRNGIDVFEQMIPVAPAAHYCCGGIKTDEHGCSSIRYLYACGECAATGLHGANRLASNSLLEALVFAHRCAEHATALFHNTSWKTEVPAWDTSGTTDPREMILITQGLKELQSTMSDYVGIVRNNIRLKRAMRRLDLLFEESQELYASTTLSPQLCELRNLITIGYLIVKSAELRQESRGLHFTTDYPEKAAILQNVVL